MLTVVDAGVANVGYRCYVLPLASHLPNREDLGFLFIATGAEREID